ncbi:hypothetical protein [uncultured Nostoc sp.]|uniref:hypothetical protein n=1 Tax=uncultured Nostoc sp. TaxID=340711 RepID=UPI0035CB6EDB
MLLPLCFQAIARESYCQLALLPDAIHPLIQPIPTRLSPKTAIIVRWSALGLLT